MSWSPVVAGVSFMALLGGCNSVFYYPDAVARPGPDKFGIQHRELWIASAEEQRLHAWMMSPKGEARGTVVHFHGNAQNMSAHFHFVKWMVAEGYRVLTFDYRGYGQSKGTPSREGMVVDGQSVLQYVATQPPLRDAPVFVLAQSLGGAIAVPSLARSPELRPAAVILDSTFHSYRDMARRKLSEIWLTWPLQWPLSFLVTDDLSAIDDIASIDAPILVVHGTADPVVPYEFGERLYHAAKSPDRTLWKIDGGAHTSAFGREDDRTYRDRLLEYLKTRSATTASEVHQQ